MCSKSWTTSITKMNTVALKLLVIKQTVLHFFYIAVQTFFKETKQKFQIVFQRN